MINEKHRDCYKFEQEEEKFLKNKNKSDKEKYYKKYYGIDLWN